jgi:hypothetical protein
MKASAALLLVVGLTAFVAHASGSYSGSFLSPSFKYGYAQTIRKSFIDDDSAHGYFESEDRAAKIDFLGFQPKVERAIGEAKKRGTPVAPFDLLLPAVVLKQAMDVAKIDKAAYPLNLVLDVSSDEDARERIEVTATAPWTAAQLTSLTATLKKLVAVKGAHHESSDEKDAAEKARIAAAGFETPVAATHIDELFGLYVGTTVSVMAADKARVLGLLQAQLAKAVPVVRARFTEADPHLKLNLPAPLNPVKVPVEKHPQGLPGAFHPHGPLVSGSLVRINTDLGSVVGILMISPAPAKYDWSKVHPVLSEWLEAALEDKHRALVEREAERLLPDDSR